ncbi:hypothetical protein Dsin_022723 [Dipteronia sinensis]|uniref:non-specific serine/threonine protein kinase n=1 Tax=Dipteronia sinensis TaxID=43782 RepID=A0AAE0A2B8_9ROSI|nr:hypothetical protein Dsin_022723 [Dipteronia sinensis]
MPDKSLNFFLVGINLKISDFGMVIFGGNESQANTNWIVGTYGYFSLEYAIECIFSMKSDVLSFGVLLLEIEWDMWTSDQGLELKDPVLEVVASSNHMLIRYVNRDLLCVQESAEDGPTMSDVVSMLISETAPLPSPKQPAFSHVRSSTVNSNPPISSSSRPDNCSVNNKDQSGGCVRRIPLRCEDSSDNSGEDRFLRIDEVKFPLSPKTSKVHAAEECILACFNSCSCNSYAYNGSSACYLWDAELLNLEQLSDGQTIYLKLAASEFQNPGGNKQLIWIIAVVVPLAVLLPASYIFCRWRTKRKEKEEIEISQDMLLFDMNMSIKTSTSELSIRDGAGKGKSKDAWFPLFNLASVSAATDNFSAKNKLGECGFGPVYKGKLLNGQEVGVKRLSRQSGQGLEELKNETMLIAKLQHMNLVRLLGCCIEHGEKILIYEYMPNKSLDSYLFDPIKKGLLDWGTCVKIIEGIAQRVLYLHQYSRLRIIHRDLKASNILLDSFMSPKVSDFGIARMFGGDELQASTNRIVGTFGYMSPEYAPEGIFSIKSDVFSFGVLLLETPSGRKNTGFYNTESLNLLGHAWKPWKDNKAIDLLDPILKDEASYPRLMRCINIAFLCVEENAVDRPTMYLFIMDIGEVSTSQHSHGYRIDAERKF